LEAKSVRDFLFFVSNQHIYAQLIDDEEGKTLANISDLKLKKKFKLSWTDTVYNGISTQDFKLLKKC